LVRTIGGRPSIRLLIRTTYTVNLYVLLIRPTYTYLYILIHTYTYLYVLLTHFTYIIQFCFYLHHPLYPFYLFLPLPYLSLPLLYPPYFTYSTYSLYPLYLSYSTLTYVYVLRIRFTYSIPLTPTLFDFLLWRDSTYVYVLLISFNLRFALLLYFTYVYVLRIRFIYLF